MLPVKLSQFNILNHMHIKETSITCEKCSSWLYGEIYIHSDWKKYCASCSLEEVDMHKDEAQEDLLKDLLFPCKFEKCEFILRKSQIAEHEKKCIYTPVYCSFCKIDLKDAFKFIKHLETEHKDKVTSITLTKPVIKVTIEERIKNNLYIATLHEHIFIILIQRNESKLSISAAKVQEYNGNDCNKFTIWYRSEDSEINYIKQYIPCSNLNINEDINSDIKVHEYESINIELKMYNSMSSLNIPTCPICFNSLKMKVYQCVNGHNVCVDCGKMISSCAICRSTSLNILQLKHLFSNVSMLCPNFGQGCLAPVTGDDIDAHLKCCFYRSVLCPECNTEYLKHNIFSHFKAKHKLFNNYQNFYYTMVNKHLTLPNSVYIKYKNQVFHFKLRVTGSGDDKKISYMVKLLHSENVADAEKYRFEVFTLDQFWQNVATKPTFSGYCQTTSDNNYTSFISYNTCSKYFIKDACDKNKEYYRGKCVIIEIDD